MKKCWWAIIMGALFITLLLFFADKDAKNNREKLHKE